MSMTMTMTMMLLLPKHGSSLCFFQNGALIVSCGWKEKGVGARAGAGAAVGVVRLGLSRSTLAFVCVRVCILLEVSSLIGC